MLKKIILSLMTIIMLIPLVSAGCSFWLQDSSCPAGQEDCINNPIEPLDGDVNDWFYMYKVWVKNTGDSSCYALVECDWEDPTGTHHYPNYCFWSDPGITSTMINCCIGKQCVVSGTWQLHSCAVYRSDYSDCRYWYTPQDDEIDLYPSKTWLVATTTTTIPPTTTTINVTTTTTTTTTAVTTTISPTLTDCAVLSSAGTYTLGNDLEATLIPNNRNCAGACCIEITSDDVTLDLNNYTIEDSADTLYGVYAGSVSDVQVKNGEIKFFDTAIRFDDVVGGYIEHVTANINDYSCFKTTGVNTQNIHITNNDCYGDEYGIEMRFCFDNCRIAHNTVWDADTAVYLQGKGITVDENNLGYWEEGESGGPPPCTRTEYQVYQGIVCDFCKDTVIKNNYINIWDEYAIGPAIVFKDHAENVRTMFNELELDPTETMVGEYDSSTLNNVWCDNRIVDWFLEIGEECWWTQYGENSAGYVQDYNDNDIAPFCSEQCDPGYHCRDESTLVYLNSQCDVQYEWLCEYGCSEGECIGERLPAVPTTEPYGPPSEWETEYNITSAMWMRPIVNATQLQQANATWLIPFFTPFFLSILGMMVISGVLTYLSKSAVTFPLCILVFALVFGVIGIIPAWIAAIIVIIGAFLVGLIMKGMITT